MKKREIDVKLLDCQDSVVVPVKEFLEQHPEYNAYLTDIVDNQDVITLTWKDSKNYLCADFTEDNISYEYYTVPEGKQIYVCEPTEISEESMQGLSEIVYKFTLKQEPDIDGPINDFGY